jgi:transcriptional regulator with XRE-family HTH domain
MEALRRRREARGMSQRELAEHAGITPRTLWRIENDEGSPTLWTLERIAAALNCNVRDLLDEEDPRREFLVENLVAGVEAGKLQASEAIDAMRDLGILGPRRGLRTR